MKKLTGGFDNGLGAVLIGEHSLASFRAAGLPLTADVTLDTVPMAAVSPGSVGTDAGDTVCHLFSVTLDQGRIA